MSASGVTLDENITSEPEKPQASLMMSSASDEQSTPQPSSLNMDSR